MFIVPQLAGATLPLLDLFTEATRVYLVRHRLQFVLELFFKLKFTQTQLGSCNEDWRLCTCHLKCIMRAFLLLESEARRPTWLLVTTLESLADEVELSCPMLSARLVKAHVRRVPRRCR